MLQPHSGIGDPGLGQSDVIQQTLQQYFNVDMQQSHEGNGKDDDDYGDKVADGDGVYDFSTGLQIIVTTTMHNPKMMMSIIPGSENGAGLSWEHGQLHPGLFSHHEYDYG